ncbi:MAG: AmmeMemoRadiSam system protein B [Bdellovibrionaceae bacterium]|nr:AmmeMemoRadiSam system protein B [Bdellovibrionales bacterium]MCB9083279.1 AmmeMemoRadiSam system protein B [Pseudobdellovibrionaceae bacterium]
MEHVRQPAVAGAFYPSSPELIRAQIQEFMGLAAEVQWQAKALVVPHAGYIYSGPIAAQAYQSLTALGSTPSRVILLGPSHRVPVRSMALPSASSFLTPLGSVAIDHQAAKTLGSLEFVELSDEAHAFEHSLEVQLPFLQTILGQDFQILPLVVGHASPEQICQALELVTDKDSLIVVSTDLSHYLSYRLAQSVDQETVSAILKFQSDVIEPNRACGAYPLKGLMKYAQKMGWKPELLDLRNSGDTAGDKDRVVGYGALLYHE